MEITPCPPEFEVTFKTHNDPANPRNWSAWYKAFLIGCASWTTWLVVLYSTTYTSGIQELMSEFNSSNFVVTLGVTTYLCGLAVGAVLSAPLGEIYGRKVVLVVGMFMFIVFLIPCNFTTAISQILVLRFLGAMAGSVSIANSPGILVDVVPEESRALAYSIWSIGPLNGPVFGAVIGGFVTQYLGWRWANWLILIFAGFSFAMLCCIKETYPPVILRRQANELRLKTGDGRWWSRHEQNIPLREMLRVNLSRPLKMTFHEPIIIFFNVYIGLIYGILYLCFVAYPYVFHEVRGWTLGLSGLAFLGIGLGGLLTIVAEPLIKRMIQSHKPDPGTGRPPPECMMSIVCIASVLIPTGQLWFSWTCLPTRIHWIWPILAGVPIGAGNIAVFIYATTYLANTYELYAASALASNTVVRSVLGGVLPLIGSRLYQSLGANWASSLLGFLQMAIIPIPFVFYKYGDRIRKRSSLIASIQEEKTRNALPHGSGGLLRRDECQEKSGGLHGDAEDVPCFIQRQTGQSATAAGADGAGRSWT